MDPSSVATSAVVIVIVLVLVSHPVQGKESGKVSHLSLTHRVQPIRRRITTVLSADRRVR